MRGARQRINGKNISLKSLQIVERRQQRIAICLVSRSSNSEELYRAHSSKGMLSPYMSRKYAVHPSIYSSCEKSAACWSAGLGYGCLSFTSSLSFVKATSSVVISAPTSVEVENVFSLTSSNGGNKKMILPGGICSRDDTKVGVVDSRAFPQETQQYAGIRWSSQAKYPRCCKSL